MARPVKGRRVCCLPTVNTFGPMNPPEGTPDMPIVMAVDEYETIRLIDLEGLTQEACATQMSVARTTVQRIYNDARRKLAESLVNGRTLKIEGGEYVLCVGVERQCKCSGCQKRTQPMEE